MELHCRVNIHLADCSDIYIKVVTTRTAIAHISRESQEKRAGTGLKN